jgi:SAM-dependent methyltransferase
MSRRRPAARVSESPPKAAATIFQKKWPLYRKMVDHNYLFHREAYSRLHQILLEEAPLQFRFLDLACGDATASAEALEGTEVASYVGVDLAGEALGLASRALASLRCTVALLKADFIDALATWEEPADVIWIGLSLHHLRAPEKLEAMRAARRLLGSDGMLLIYENVSPDGEDRDGWLRRWDLQEADWTGLTRGEWRRMRAHVHAHDFPETVSGWRQLGQEAQFEAMQELFVAPTNLFRLFAFRVSA